MARIAGRRRRLDHFVGRRWRGCPRIAVPRPLDCPRATKMSARDGEGPLITTVALLNKPRGRLVHDDEGRRRLRGRECGTEAVVTHLHARPFPCRAIERVDLECVD